MSYTDPSEWDEEDIKKRVQREKEEELLEDNKQL